MTGSRILFAGAAILATLAAVPAGYGRVGMPPETTVQETAAVPLAEPDLAHGRAVAMGGQIREASTPCVQCHGILGASDGSGAFPRLTDQSAWYLYKSLKDYASGQRRNPVMTPIARALTERQMQDVAAYYASVEEVPYPPPPTADPLTLQLGGALSAIGAPERGIPACVNCHGAAGLGMPPSFPYLAGQYASYIELQLRLWQEGRRDGDPLNIMARIAERMTPEDIRAVALYFATVRPEAVTPRPAEILR